MVSTEEMIRRALMVEMVARFDNYLVTCPEEEFAAICALTPGDEDEGEEVCDGPK